MNMNTFEIALFFIGSERLAADLENRTADFEDTANIFVDIIIGSDSINVEEKESGDEEDCQVNPYIKK